VISAKASVNLAFKIGPVRRRTFGSFIEHLGRAVYTGIYEPLHPSSNEDGFREDVIALVKELGISTVRYPGGNFVSGYNWEDGVGPQGERPRRLDLAWHSLEPNTVGIDEFVKWTRAAGVEPMMAVNLGTRGVAEALAVLEYSNIAGGTTRSDARRANGAEEPHNISMWCLGNEMDGPWQTGHKTAEEYGRLAAETARAMRQMQPDLELIACGSSSSEMPTFGSWEHTVLTEAYDLVDMISAHAYYFEEEGDLDSFLASSVNMDRFIDSVVATADAVKAAGGHKKEIGISFDEWNVWYQKAEPSKPPSGDDWPIAPKLLEDNYSVLDAVVVGSLLISLLKHTDRVYSASLAQLVNVIAPIMTEPEGPVWKQTIFHPFAQAANLAKGEVLRLEIDSPTFTTKKYGEVPVLDAAATYAEELGELVVFAVNRSKNETLNLNVDLGDSFELVQATSYHNDDYRWTASLSDSFSVLPANNPTATINDAYATAMLPPISWNVLRFTQK